MNVEKYRKAVGSRVEALRKEAGLNQDDVALQAGMHRTGYNKAIHGTQAFAIEEVVMLSEFFGVPTDHILRGEPIPEVEIEMTEGPDNTILTSLPNGIKIAIIRELCEFFVDDLIQRGLANGKN